MTQVRRATDADIPTLVEMGQRFISETPYHDQLAFDPEQAEHFGRWLLTYEKGLIVVLDIDGATRGMLGAITIVHPFSSAVVASELFWWVEPEARGAGIRLLREFQRWGRSMGASALNMVAPNERVAHVYERLGFELIESMYGRAV